MTPLRVLVLAGLALAAGAAPASAAISSTYTGAPSRILTITSDDAADTVVVTCDAGIKVNDAPPPSGALTCTEVYTLLVNGNGGADVLDVSQFDPGDVNIGTTTLDGGDGDDDVRGIGFGSSGYFETVRGGEGNDTLAPNGAERAQGGNGDDRIVGFQSGGVDGEPIDGGAGTDTHALDAVPVALNLILTVKDSGLTLSAPENPGTTTASFTSIERVDLNLNDAAQTVDATEFSGSARVRARGGSDTLLGTPNADDLDGGGGNDFLEGGSGPDVYQGGPGFDLVRARDDAADTGDCGSDEDTAVADALDAFTGCERIDLPPQPVPPPTPPDTTAPALTFGTAVSGRRALRLPVACPAGETRCTGVLRLTATGRLVKKRRSVRFGPVVLTAVGGSTVTLTRRTTSAQRRTLRKLSRRRLRVATDVVDALGNRAQTTQTVALRAPR